MLHKGCPAIKYFRQNMEVFKSEFPSYYTPQFYSQQFQLLPTRLAFCGKTNNAKLEKIQERSLRIMCTDYTSSYEDLLRNTGLSTLLLNRLQSMLLETFKSTRRLNARAVMHVRIAILQWRGKRSRHSRCMRNPHFYVFGKRPMHCCSC